jgi:hemolysin D
MKKLLTKIFIKLKKTVSLVNEFIKSLIAKWNNYLDSKLYYEFLPSKLELLEKPSPFLSYLILKVIYSAIVIAFLICYFGKVDIVAVSSGKVIPTGNVKVIQPLNQSEVIKIHVKEGQIVSKGDALVSLNAVDWEKDLEILKHQLKEKKVQVDRLKATVNLSPFEYIDIYDKEIYLREKLIYESEKLEYLATVQSYIESIEQSEEDIKRQGYVILSIKNKLPLLKEKHDIYKGLLAEKIASKSQAYSYMEEYIETSENLKALKRQKQQLVNSMESIQEQKKSKESEFKKTKYMELSNAKSELSQIEKQVEKLYVKSKQQDLKSPIDGRVTQLVIHTEGGVVSSAQELMKIVPLNQDMYAEVMLENKDIGFVYEGQKVNVKLDAFPFTKYGLITGEVMNISQDAVADEKRGLLFTAKVKLNKQYITVNGNNINLIPGMSLSAEIKTGTRRIIEFFLSPVMQHIDESMRER